MSSPRTARLVLAGLVALVAACQDVPAPLAPDELTADHASVPAEVQERIAALHDRISHELLPLAGVVFTAPDPENGRVVIGIEKLQMSRGLSQALAARGIGEVDYVFEETEPYHFMSTGLRTRHRPTVGGIQINFSGYVCTLGFNVSHSAGRSFITNSHCTANQGSNSGTRYYQPSSSTDATVIADEAHDPAYFTGGPCPSGRRCRYSDSSRALYRSGTSSSRGLIARPTGVNNGSLTVNGHFTITSQNNTATSYSGTLNKVGRTTGWTRGSVASTCANVNVANTNITLLCQTRVNANVAGGDSGSPVFRVISGSDVQLVGILWGGNSTSFVFSPLKNIRDELGAMTATR